MSLPRPPLLTLLATVLLTSVPLYAASTSTLTPQEAHAFSDHIGDLQRIGDIGALAALRSTSTLRLEIARSAPGLDLRLDGVRFRAFMTRSLQDRRAEPLDPKEPDTQKCEYEALRGGNVLETCTEQKPVAGEPTISVTVIARDEKGPYFAQVLLTDSPESARAAEKAGRELRQAAPVEPTGPATPRAPAAKPRPPAGVDDDVIDNRKS